MIKLERSETVDWNDPRAWGFCSGCAFQEPRDIITGLLLEHVRLVGNVDRECDGGGRIPDIQPGPEAHPDATVGFRPVVEPPVIPTVPLWRPTHGPEPEHTD